MSLTVPRGSFCALLGVNGAGKSTLFSLITRLYDSTSGRIEVAGFDARRASRQALARAGMTIDDMDLYEINEAFAAQVLPSADDLGMDLDKLNAHGGAIALGHPFGSTGTRIMTTLLNGLEARDGQFGLETMCVGGGQGMAIIVERLS